jgi:hypothetical protein
MTSVEPLDHDEAFAANAVAAQDRVSAATLDEQFGEVKDRFNELVSSLGRLIRDDDTLGDGVVRARNLHEEVIAALASLSFLASARAATTANITLSGAQTIDGIAIVAGDRVLVRAQTLTTENGIYVAAAGAWSRASDAAAGAALLAATAVYVESGTVHGRATFKLSADTTVGNALAWLRIGGADSGTSAIAGGGTGQATVAAWPTFYRRLARAVGVANVVVSAPGATLDGVALAAGDRVLLTGQTTASQNGLWQWNGAAVTMTRTGDYPTSSTDHATADVLVEIREGTAYAASRWRLSTAGVVTIDTTSTTWSQLQPGALPMSGTVARTLAARFADVANVLDFGAKGDGATDDTAAFQAALATGRSVYVPGTSSFYLINGTLTYGADGQAVLGDGYLSFVKQTHATANLFYATGRTAILLRGLRLMPSTGRTSSRDGCAAQFYNSSRCAMVDNFVTYSASGNKAGLSMDTCSDFEVSGNSFSGSTVSAGAIESTGGADIDCIYSAQRGLVANNRINSGNSHGIKFQTIGVADVCAFNRVVGNIVTGCKGHGIQFYNLNATSTMKKNAIVGNTVSDIKGSVTDAGLVYVYGIGIYNAGGSETLIANNTIENVCQSTVSESLPVGGIGTDWDDTLIIGNTVDTSGKHGIRADNSGSRTTDTKRALSIVGNHVKSTTKDGISVNYVWRTLIAKNQVYASAHGAIVKSGNTGAPDPLCIIEGNTVETTTGGADAIIVGANQTAIVRGNVVLNSNEHGIVSTFNTDLLIAENVVKTCVNNGIQIDANTTRGQVRGNTITGCANGIQNNGSAVVYSDNLFASISGAATVGNSFATFAASNGGGTPDVSGHRYFKTSATTAITDFLGKSDGKELTVFFLHAVTVTNGAGLQLAGNVNASATVGSSMTFRYDLASTRWVETGRSLH